MYVYGIYKKNNNNNDKCERSVGTQSTLSRRVHYVFPISARLLALVPHNHQ
jgi:hypothetical protein